MAGLCSSPPIQCQQPPPWCYPTESSSCMAVGPVPELPKVSCAWDRQVYQASFNLVTFFRTVDVNVYECVHGRVANETKCAECITRMLECKARTGISPEGGTDFETADYHYKLICKLMTSNYLCKQVNYLNTFISFMDGLKCICVPEEYRSYGVDPYSCRPTPYYGDTAYVDFLNDLQCIHSSDGTDMAPIVDTLRCGARPDNALRWHVLNCYSIKLKLASGMIRCGPDPCAPVCTPRMSGDTCYTPSKPSCSPPQCYSPTQPPCSPCQQPRQRRRKNSKKSRIKAMVRTKIRCNKVMIFTKTNCCLCSKAVKVFEQYIGRELRREEMCVMDLCGRDDCDLIQNYLQKLTGTGTVPRIFINGRCLGGYTETEVSHQCGRLAELLCQ